MRITVISLLLLCSVLAQAFLSGHGFADTLVIPDISNQPGNTPDGVPRPVRGMTMDQVREQFGEPRDIKGPVGNPRLRAGSMSGSW